MLRSIVVLSGVLGLVTPVFAESVTGQLIDLACYLQDKSNTGVAHKNKGLNCARACAREGFPVALLTTDGKIYRVTGALAANSNAKLVPHMSHTVTLTGDVTQKDGETIITSGDLKMEHP